MGGHPADPAASKGAIKRPPSDSGSIQNGVPIKHDRRNPSPRRTGNKPNTTLPGGKQQEKMITAPGDEPAIQQQQVKNLLEKNTFHTLKDGETGITSVVKPKNNGKKNQKQPNDPVPERKEKCPPIYVQGDPPELRPSLRKCIDQGLRCTFRLCTQGVKIITEGKAHYQMVLGFLAERKYEYFTHDFPGSKPLKVVLRGLDDMDIKELTEELASYGPRPSNIFKISRHDQTRKYRDQLYLVHFERGSVTLKDLSSITAVNHTVVKWERYKPVHRDVTQCMNCFHFGHGTKNCHLMPRCNVCSANHPSSECDAMEEADPLCANCGGKHRASCRKCPKRAEFIRIRKSASTGNQPHRGRAPAVTESNFPELVHKNQRNTGNQPPSSEPSPTGSSANTRQPPNPPGFQQQHTSERDPPEDSAPLYTAAELVQIYEQLFARLRACKTKTDQIYALGIFAIENAF